MILLLRPRRHRRVMFGKWVSEVTFWWNIYFGILVFSVLWANRKNLLRKFNQDLKIRFKAPKMLCYLWMVSDQFCYTHYHLLTFFLFSVYCRYFVHLRILNFLSVSPHVAFLDPCCYYVKALSHWAPEAELLCCCENTEPNFLSKTKKFSFIWYL